jgi:hypothetical protein
VPSVFGKISHSSLKNCAARGDPIISFSVKRPQASPQFLQSPALETSPNNSARLSVPAFAGGNPDRSH